MEIGENGLNLIKKYEGFSEKAYRDVCGVTKIGYGSIFYPDGTKVRKRDKPITEEYASEILKKNLWFFENYVRCSVRPDVNQNQFDALVSFTYDQGVGALNKSMLLRKVNSDPNNSKIREQFMKWVYPGGVMLPSYVKRRKDEADLYFSLISI